MLSIEAFGIETASRKHTLFPNAKVLQLERVFTLGPAAYSVVRDIRIDSYAAPETFLHTRPIESCGAETPITRSRAGHREIEVAIV